MAKKEDDNSVSVDKLTAESERACLGELSATYVQEGDSINGEYQVLRIKSIDGDGGRFFTIKTKRWAFDDIDELVSILQDFKKKLNDE